jgi:hypothetical protein
VACFAASVVSGLIAVVAGAAAIGLVACYGSTCSYELRGYDYDGPHALYGVLGGSALLLAVIALVGCAFSLRAFAAGSARSALRWLALVVSSAVAFSVAIQAASV